MLLSLLRSQFSRVIEQYVFCTLFRMLLQRYTKIPKTKLFNCENHIKFR